MSCTISSRAAGDVTIIDMTGRVSYQDPHLPTPLAEWINSGSRSFVVNISGVTYIDSYGLRDLVNAYKAVKDAGGKINLLRPSANVRKVLENTMKGIFEIFDDESQAIAAARLSSSDAAY